MTTTGEKGIQYGFGNGADGWDTAMDANLALLDTTMLRMWAPKASTTVASTRTFGYFGGLACNAAGNAVSLIADGTIVLPAGDGWYYIKRSTIGAVSIVGGVSASINWGYVGNADFPMAWVQVTGGVITRVVDYRPIWHVGGLNSFDTLVRIMAELRMSGNVTPSSSQSYDVGTSSTPFRYMYAAAFVPVPVFVNWTGVGSPSGFSNKLIITVSSAAGWTMATPSITSNYGVEMTFSIRNTLAGAMGTINWANYHLAGAWVNPAPGYQRSITFHYDGAWVELHRTAADVPN